ncbi:MAG: Lrp/AsnC family transcriptional regulator [Gracilimonas sp.]|uniref:Lrp/AsnC family transcriptional regulator n=1 Tax=Gracilimonas sediminicola TaxID=2952158 RepID=A0A9X2RC44_9BACT|nr:MULTISPECIES: Lrp/AsnC family transcriptional regulator [Gracilimonas]MBO6585794.1 Lrp/AsnC family transcriptional regulator [Gracilimonas sp.]MBO6616791.1 Lrp/AsnC family transcriptional regulator [Gracilimonas sp.]MCP9290606.1 Lrp/AsnC family transcriptional regulator [Gracilimonas sediminicola]
MSTPKLDATDKKIIAILQQEGRMANNELAKRIELTTTPTLERVRRLEREGIIEGYSAKVNKESVGRGFTAFVKVTLSVHQLNLLEEFTSAIKEIPEILACYHTTGDGDFLLHVVAKDTKDYEQLMRNKLTTLPDVERLHTSIVLNTIKDQSPIPVYDENED